MNVAEDKSNPAPPDADQTGQTRPADRPDAEPFAGDTNASEELQRLQADLDEANNRLLRAHADLDNYRKRVRREMDDERRYAAVPVLRDLLGVMDNLDRAMDAAEKSDSGSSLLEGVRMVAQQLGGVLQQYHCQRIEAVGQPFDPHRHEALMQQPSADHPAGTVIMETQPGYMVYDRVVRPSQVIVSSGPATGE